MRIDAHQHYWRYNPGRDTWIDDTMARLRHDFLPESAAPLLDALGFDGAIAVQADQSEAETAFLLDLASRHTRIRGVVGWVDLRSPELPERLAQWHGAKALKGFRHIAQAEPDDSLAQRDVADGVAQLGAHGYSFDLLITPAQLDSAATLVAQCPGVRFILDHCAKPVIRDRDIAAWRDGLQRLAAYPHVACKVSGLVTEARWHDWLLADLVPYLNATLDAFGTERVLFGSDWPVCLLAAEWDRVYGVVDEWSTRLTASERAALFGGNAVTMYRLEE